MLDSVEFGLKIQYYRKLNNMSQESLSDKLFVSRQALSKWELGLSFPSIDKLIYLSNILNVSIDELLKNDLKIDTSDIFKGHSREFILNEILSNRLIIDLKTEFNKFTPSERMLILKAIKENKIKYNIDDLLSLLTKSEIKYIGELK